MISALKERRSPSRELSAQLLHASDLTCCVCRRAGQALQLHHLNGDRSDDSPDNFAVLCLNCHDRTQLRGGFGRHLSEYLVRIFRDEWVGIVAERRRALRGPSAPSNDAVLPSALRQFTGVELRTVGPKRVADVDWRDLGVRISRMPAADSQGLLPFLHRGAAQRALTRQMEAAVRDATGMSTFVIEGPSGAGKSRLAYELVRKIAPPDAWLLAPTARHPSQGAPSELGVAEACDPARHLEIGPADPLVLWLDDVEELVGPGPWWIDAQALRRIAEDHKQRQLLVMITAGGKGRRSVRDRPDGGYLDLVPELDRLMALIPPAGRVSLDYRTLGHPERADRFGAKAAAEIRAVGIGPYAVGREALHAAFTESRWPEGTVPPGGADGLAEAVALTEGMLAWTFACAAGTVTQARARALWAAFRARHGLPGLTDDERWALAVAAATTPVTHDYALVERSAVDGSLGVSDLLTPMARFEDLMRHLFEHCPPRVNDADIDAVDVGARLAHIAPDLAVPWLQELHDRGNAEASHLLGYLLDRQGYERDAVSYWEAAERGGVAAAGFNLGVLDVGESRLDAAQARFEQAARDGLPEGHVRLGELCEKREDELAAIEHYRAAMDAGVGEGALRLGTLLADDDPQAALTAFETAEQLGEPRGADRAAWVLERLGDETAAQSARERGAQAIYVEPVLGWLRDLPYGSAVRWSDGSIGPGSPFGHGWLDVHFRGMGSQTMSLNWMLEIVEPREDRPAGDDLWEIVLPLSDELRLRVLHAGEDDPLPRRLIAASLWHREDGATEDVDVGSDQEELASLLGNAICTGDDAESTTFVLPVWSCACITNAIAAWIEKHIGRVDLPVEWDRDGPAPPFLQRLSGSRREEGSEPG